MVHTNDWRDESKRVGSEKALGFLDEDFGWGLGWVLAGR